MTMISCAECVYFDGSPLRDGQCRLNPPVVVSADRFDGVAEQYLRTPEPALPFVVSDDGCGQGKRAEEAQALAPPSQAERIQQTQESVQAFLDAGGAAKLEQAVKEAAERVRAQEVAARVDPAEANKPMTRSAPTQRRDLKALYPPRLRRLRGQLLALREARGLHRRW